MAPEGWRPTTYGEAAIINRETLSVQPGSRTVIQYLDIGSVAAPGRIKATQTLPAGDAPSRARRRVRAGDTLVSTVRPQLRAIVHFADAPENLIASTGFAVLSPNPEVDPKFLYQATLRAEFTADLVKRQTGSNYPAVRPADIAQLPLLLPPLPEQRQIAAILSSVDETIEKTEGLICALKAVRKSLLEDLFVPKGGGRQWPSCSLEYLCTRIVDGVHRKPSYVPQGIPFVTVKNLTAGPGISFTNLNYISETDHRQFTRRADPEFGDVLLSKDGTLGVPRVVETAQSFSIFVSVALLKPKRELIDSYFLRYALESPVIASQFRLNGAGSALQHIHLVDLRKTQCPVPLIEEQRAIARGFRTLDERLSAEQIYAQQLNLMKDSLANALVTGQIRVTPDEALS